MSDEENDSGLDETNGLAAEPVGDGADVAGADEPESHGLFGRIIEGVESVFEGNAPFPSAGEASDYSQEERLIEERDVL
ncbi:MAG: hypothetical protein JWQ64_2207 [Subtercola sp.]|nr:hypothetical protein [Subtercola sp.]